MLVVSKEGVVSKRSNLKLISVYIISGLVIGGVTLQTSLATATMPYIFERVNLTHLGAQMSSTSNIQDPPILSQDGRYVAFSTNDPNIVNGDSNNAPDVFVRDRKLGQNVRANVSDTGAQLPLGTEGFKMSANGRFVAFKHYVQVTSMYASNGMWQVYVRDLKNNTTETVSLSTTGDLSNSSISFFDISADGRFVTFSTDASNLVSGDTNNFSDIFIRDRKLGTTTLISKNSSGFVGNGSSVKPAISCDGSYVAFISSASDLAAGDTNGFADVFLVDRLSNDNITNITINGNNSSGGSGEVDLSCNGSTVVFQSHASNLVANDTNSKLDLFAFNMVDSLIQRVNLDSSNSQSSTSIIQDRSTNVVDFSGRYIVFASNATDLTTGDTNGKTDVFLRDIVDGTTQIVTRRNSSTQTSDASYYSSISLDGSEVIFMSHDGGLVGGDTNNNGDIFTAKTGI